MTLKQAGLHIWLARRKQDHRIGYSGETFAVIDAKRSVRDLLRSNHSGKAHGKGNKAWNRVKRMEAEFRASGGFTLEDIYLGRI